VLSSERICSEMKRTQFKLGDAIEIISALEERKSKTFRGNKKPLENLLFQSSLLTVVFCQPEEYEEEERNCNVD